MINSRRIEDLHPVVRAACQQHIDRCAKAGITIILTSTLRDDEYQATLYAKGRTAPGGVVTNVKVTGAHGLGLAYDVVPVVKGQAVWNDARMWKRIGDIGKQLGFVWGGDWKGFVDKPHFEMTQGLKFADLRAGKRPTWFNPPAPPEPTAEPIRILEVGMRGDDVKALQLELKALGYKLSTDGSFGPATEQVVKQFQTDNKLKADGLVGPATQKKLNQLVKKIK